jgi:hypothetical protein
MLNTLPTLRFSERTDRLGKPEGSEYFSSKGEVGPMRTIGRMAAELLGVLLAGVVSFFAAIAFVFGALFIWVCGIVSGLFLIAALFSGVMWLFTRNPHAFHTMLGFFGYAGVPFLLIVVMTYYHGKWTDWLKRHDPQAVERPRIRMP